MLCFLNSLQLFCKGRWESEQHSLVFLISVFVYSVANLQTFFCAVPKMSMLSFYPFSDCFSLPLGIWVEHAVAVVFCRIWDFLLKWEVVVLRFFPLVTLKNVHLQNVLICLWNLWKKGVLKIVPQNLRWQKTLGLLPFPYSWWALLLSKSNKAKWQLGKSMCFSNHVKANSETTQRHHKPISHWHVAGCWCPAAGCLLNLLSCHAL